MLYDRPVRELLKEWSHGAPPVFARSEVVEWFALRYPAVKKTTVSAHVTSATVNDRNRRHYGRAGDLFFKLPNKWFELYQPPKHGKWSSIGEPLDDLARSLVEEPAVPSAPRSSSRADGGPVTTNMTGAEFQEWARSVLMDLWGVQLDERPVRLHGGVEKRFDLVSPDGRVVGDAKYYKSLATPAAKWSTIAEYVWLLEHVDGADRRFLVFGNDRDVPQRWLDRFGPLVGDVEFLFLDDAGVASLT